MRIHFLGTNGWFPTGTGTTACAAIEFRDRLIVLDAGAGFCKLPSLMSRLGKSKADVFLSHLHIDHIEGLHTLPLVPRGKRIRIFIHRSCLPALRRFLSHPYTATPREEYAKVTLHPLKTGENSVPYKVNVLPLRHADPCFGYRFGLGGKSAAYCTDTGPCKNISRLGKGAGLLITECALLPGAPRNHEWPHLSPEMAAEAARDAMAKRLALTHFDAYKYPSLSSRAKAQAAARKIFKGAVAARDDLILEF